MKKSTIVITAIAVLLGILAIYLVSSRSDTTISKKHSDFAIEDTATVTKIYITDKDNNEITLDRGETGSWKVNGKYNVRTDAMELMLNTIHKIKVQRPVPKAAHNTIVKLLAARSKKVEIYKNAHRVSLSDNLKFFPYEKLAKTYYVGQATQTNTGTYMLLEGSETPFITYIPSFRGFLSTRFTTDVADWRDPAIFRKEMDEIKSLNLRFNENPDESFKVEQVKQGEFKLYDLTKNRKIRYYDTLRMYDLMTSFKNISFESVLNDKMKQEKYDSILSSKPFHKITLTDMNGEQQTVKTYHRPAPAGETDHKGNPVKYDRDRMYALINDGQDFVLIQFYVFDKILHPLSYYAGE
ncbi:MAG: DUF4340 domain-containing protein [Bacteroidales bacterium]|nr:DUF4340 domain-containing protein [Bacteroidales bacterium]